MNKLLTIKHWQLFLLLIGLPMILQFALMGFIIFGHNIATVFIGFSIVMIFFMIIFVGWFYSLGTNLYKRLPASANMSLKKYKLFLFFYVAYTIFVLGFIINMFVTVQLDGRPDPQYFFLMVPVHLFAMFCIIYCLNFNAKALKTIELQRPVTFSDYIAEFILLWMFPLGIWILQPRINKLMQPAI